MKSPLGEQSDPTPSNNAKCIKLVANGSSSLAYFTSNAHEEQPD